MTVRREDAIYATPGAQIDITFDKAPTGLVGVFGVEIVDTNGNVITPRTTGGIIELVAGSGIYRARIVAPAAMGDYVVVADTGNPGPAYAEQPLSVTATGIVPIVWSGPGYSSPDLLRAEPDVDPALTDAAAWRAI